MPKKIFSVPLNPKLSPEQFGVFYSWLGRNKEWISDVYFTSRIAPFTQDAMGDIFVIQEDHMSLIEVALNIQNHLGIPVSATFNNIQVPPTQQNLDIFMLNFKRLYDAGIKIATIPHTHWVATGQLQKAFPELYIKNTILRTVKSAVEVVNLAKYGFNYVNIDRNLMRDKEALLRLKEAKVWVKENLGKDIAFSLLANEGCLGECPMMAEHFEFNNTRTQETPQYFNDSISRVSCPKWEVQDPAVYLKTANLPPWREDWEEFVTDLGIDVFKMHGRESLDRLWESMTIIDRYVAGEQYLHENFEQYLAETNLDGKPIDVWRKKIKSCKFDCWECQYCDRIESAKNDKDYSDLVKHVAECVADSGVPKVKFDIYGLTSVRVQTLLNSIAKGVGNYLEVGSYLGATAAAALKDNPLVAYCVDTWDQQIQPAKNLGTVAPPNNMDKFLSNIDPYIGSSKVFALNNDMLLVDLTLIQQPIQLFFYDGPHEEEQVIKAIQYYYPVLADECVIIFDDANWDGTVSGANKAFESMGMQLIYKKLILNSLENPREWWNGIYVTVVKK